MKNLLLIWGGKDKTRYFLMGDGEISTAVWSMLVRMNGRRFSFNNSDDEEKFLWRIKAAVSDSNAWIPKAHRAWEGIFLPFEKYLPLATRKASLVVVHIGYK